MKKLNPKKLNETIRKNLLRMMVGDGRTQQDRAKRAGITQATLSRIMAGKQNVSVVNLVRLANYFGPSCTLADLVGWEAEEP